ncbi:4Fe-4S dicluster domain-containing protein [Phaeobacter porticola]|uniref:Pyruvate:ferredoxin oxidoreductase n=1 Tax=Phaeobacter porticola TaxID=1844006 RepID=A0A1L3I3L4_9RHOB|nr:4Fe-4S binding protein [Phaeobacter porticola]APG46714.1 Pyruvate:ferredoxin oxidoreductase [Phaeobacter porticola]
MTIWENVQLSLRSQPGAQELLDRRQTVRVSHPGSSYRRYNPESDVRWPLAALCAAATARRVQQTKNEELQPERIDQVLVLHDAQTRARLIGLQDRVSVSGMNVTVAATSGLERAGHADLLHAVSDGFDWVLLEAAEEKNARLAQLREMELAACLGLEERVALFHSVAHLEQLLSEGIGQLPEITHRSEDAKGIAKPSHRREAIQLFASVTLAETADVVALPQDAPYGGIEITGDCTLCQACTWVCPTSALIGTENGSGLDFVEADCMQCGLCVSVCGQNALSLVPRLEICRDRLPVSLTHPSFCWSDGMSGSGAIDQLGRDGAAIGTDTTGGLESVDAGPLHRPLPAAGTHDCRRIKDHDHDGPDDWPKDGAGRWSEEAVSGIPDEEPASLGRAQQNSRQRSDLLPDCTRLLSLFGVTREDKLS